jgi:glycosyltransferase involved in cell wall biosynthesis
MSDNKLITILIPVYNGAKFLGGLLESFATYIHSDPDGPAFLTECEILVVNNRSEDTTLEIARSFERHIKNLRVVTPKTHVPSAEENVFRSFGLANGEYTWVLGVDDIVRFDAFSEVLQVARDGLYDMAVFNFMQSDQNGRFETACNFYMQEHAYEGDVVSLTQRVGFWWLIAGFSGQIVRTALVANYDHAGLISETSPIYSHVTAYLECLAGRPAAIVNIQNVIYRLSDNDAGHWRRAAAKFNVFDEYFWTLGYVRQIAYLERKGVVGRDYLIRMLETNRNSVFRPTAVIYDKLLTQLRSMESDPDPRNRLTRSEFEELVGYFEQRDLLARPFLESARGIFQALVSNQTLEPEAFDTARWRLQCYQSSFPLAANCVGVDGDYELYELDRRLFAVHRLFRGAMLDRFRYLDHAAWAPIVFEGSSRAAIAKQIAEEGLGTDLDNLPVSAMRFCSLPIQHGTQAWNAPTPQRVVSAQKLAPPPMVLAAPTPVVEEPAPVAGVAQSPELIEVPNLLQIAQWNLRHTYKNRTGYPVGVAAWLAAQGLKATRWLSKPERHRLLGGTKRAAA